MTAKQLDGRYAPDGSTYSTITDGDGNLSTEPVLITGGLKQRFGNRAPDGSRYRILTDGNGTIFAGGGGGGGYVAKAVHFANIPGSDLVGLSTSSLSCVDNGLFSMSGWFKLLKAPTATALASPGSIPLTGALAGQTVYHVNDFTQPADGSADFESTISINGHIQQIGTSVVVAGDQLVVTLPGTNPNPILWVSDPINNYVNFMDTNGLQGSVVNWSPYFSSADFNSHLNIEDSTTADFDGNWHHLLYSANMNFAAGSRIFKFYIDNVDVSQLQSDVGISFQPVFNDLSFYLGDDAFGGVIVGDLADVWIAPGVSLLGGGGDISSANRGLFIDQATLKPVNPSGFPPTAMLFSGDATAFGTNQGTGGAFTLTGTLTDASTSPSD